MSLRDTIHDVAIRARAAGEALADLRTRDKDAWLARAADRLISLLIGPIGPIGTTIPGAPSIGPGPPRRDRGPPDAVLRRNGR